MAASLTGDEERKISRILVDLLKQSEADECMVCDAGGHVLAQESSGKSTDPFSISALGAGVFGASRQLAMILGRTSSARCSIRARRRACSSAPWERMPFCSASSPIPTPSASSHSTRNPSRSRCALFDAAEQRGSTVPTEYFRPFVLSKDENIFQQTP